MAAGKQVLSDKVLRCRECGTEFIFTSAEQRRWIESGHGRDEPWLCPGCRVLQRRLEAIHAREGRLVGSDQEGRVKWYDRRKGFGFLHTASDEEWFVHRSGLAEGVHTLRRGERVVFDVRVGEKGSQAVNVRPSNRQDEAPREAE